MKEVFPFASALRCYAREAGWEILEDNEEEIVFPIERLELISVFFEREEGIRGEELMRRSREMRANLSQKQAEYLLSRQEQIPEEWKDYYLLFPGTVYGDRAGNKFIPCLCPYGSIWYLLPLWIGYYLCKDIMLLRPRRL